MSQLKLEIIREFSESMGVPTCCTHALKFALERENLDTVRKNLKNWAAKHKHDDNAFKLVSLLREEKFIQLADYLEEYLKDNRLCEQDNNPTSTDPLLSTAGSSIEPYNRQNDLNTPISILIIEENSFTSKRVFVSRFIRRNCSRRFSFLSSLIFMIIGIATFTSAGLFYSYTVNTANKIGQIEMAPTTEIAINALSTIVTTDTPLPILDKMSSCFGGQSSQTPPSAEGVISILPDWREPLDLCHSAPTELIIYDDSGIFSEGQTPKVLCPQNVVALEIFSKLTEFQLKNLFSSFCNVSNITFVGNENCDVSQNNKIRKFLSPNLISLSFEDMFSCGRLFEKFVDQFYFPNLKTLSFSCVSFLKGEIDVVDKVISGSKKFEEVICADGDMCRDLISHLTASVKMTTKKASCGLGG